MYPGLVQGAIAAILRHGIRRAEADLSAEDDRRRMDRHDESDRAALRHRSRACCAPRRSKQADGTYKITGTKIFISGGEQDLTENIVHLVLARIEGAPEGTKGISLFIVPKILLERGRLARRAQRRLLRLDRREDGHPRQLHLRDELRRRDRLPDRRGESRPQRHVRDDERGAARRRPAGPRAVRGRLSERRRPTRRSACRAARSRARNFPTSRPIRSSCIPTCAAR